MNLIFDFGRQIRGIVEGTLGICSAIGFVDRHSSCQILEFRDRVSCVRNELRQLAPQNPNFGGGRNTQFDFAVFDLSYRDYDLVSNSDFFIPFSGQYQHDCVRFL